MWFCDSIRASQTIRGRYIEEYDMGKDILTRNLENIPDPNSCLIWVSLQEDKLITPPKQQKYTIKQIGRSFNNIGRTSVGIEERKK